MCGASELTAFGNKRSSEETSEQSHGLSQRIFSVVYRDELESCLSVNIRLVFRRSIVLTFCCYEFVDKNWGFARLR